MNDQYLNITSKPQFVVTRSTKLSRFGVAAGVIIILALATGPFWLGRADMRLLVEIFYFLALAQMWNLLAG